MLPLFCNLVNFVSLQIDRSCWLGVNCSHTLLFTSLIVLLGHSDAEIDQFCTPYTAVHDSIRRQFGSEIPPPRTLLRCFISCLPWETESSSSGCYLTVACFLRAIHTMSRVTQSHRRNVHNCSTNRSRDGWANTSCSGEHFCVSRAI